MGSTASTLSVRVYRIYSNGSGAVMVRRLCEGGVNLKIKLLKSVTTSRVTRL